jgi:hypothetical protein
MSNPKRAIFIDAKNKSVTEIAISQLEDLQSAVEGYIEIGVKFASTDVLFVNEEGLLRGFDYGFYIEGCNQMFIGNGIIVGTTRSGNNADVEISLDAIRARTHFIVPDQVWKGRTA